MGIRNGRAVSLPSVKAGTPLLASDPISVAVKQMLA
jgi:hypothetical protein